MKLTKQTGDVPADVLVEMMQRMIRSTGSVPPVSEVEACLLLDTVVADLADEATADRRREIFDLGNRVRARVLAANP